MFFFLKFLIFFEDSYIDELFFIIKIYNYIENYGFYKDFRDFRRYKGIYNLFVYVMLYKIMFLFMCGRNLLIINYY